jgi:hypothetical protein
MKFNYLSRLFVEAGLGAVSALLLLNILTSAASASPVKPWPEAELDEKLECLYQVQNNLHEVIDEEKIKTSRISKLFAKDPFLKVVPHRSGKIYFSLAYPEQFVEGNKLGFSLSLREDETISGPMRKMVDEILVSYIAVLEETIKYYADQKRVIDRKHDVVLGYPRGLLIYEKPHSSNPLLMSIYNELWRDQDGLPAGTAGILTVEAREGLELKHLRKAQNRVAQLLTCLKSEQISKADRKKALQVLNDLQQAIAEALGGLS